jgi:hypothetical protein
MVVIACVILLTGLTLIRPRLALLYIFFSFSFEQLLRTRAPDVVSSGLTALLPPIRFSQIVTLVLSALMLITWLRHMRVPKPGAMFWFFLAYLGLCFASIGYSINPSDSLRQTVIVLMGGATALTIRWWIQDIDQARELVRVLFWGAVIHCVWALFQLLCYMALGLEIGYYAPGMGSHLKERTFGWMFEPNWFGVFLVAVFPWFLFALDYQGEINISRRTATGGLVIFMAALLLNMSRLAWLSVAVQLLLWATFSFPHLKRYLTRSLIWALPVLICGLFLISITPESIRNSFVAKFIDLTLIEQGKGSANVRYVTYVRLGGLIVQRLWFGYGMGVWSTIPQLREIGSGPTTTFMYIWVEVGIVGLSCFVALTAILIARLYRAYRQASAPYQAYLLTSLVSVVGLCVAAWFADMKSVLSYFPIFGLYLGLARMAEAQRRMDARVVPTNIAQQSEPIS